MPEEEKCYFCSKGKTTKCQGEDCTHWFCKDHGSGQHCATCIRLRGEDEGPEEMEAEAINRFRPKKKWLW